MNYQSLLILLVLNIAYIRDEELRIIQASKNFQIKNIFQSDFQIEISKKIQKINERKRLRSPKIENTLLSNIKDDDNFQNMVKEEGKNPKKILKKYKSVIKKN